MSVWLAQDMTAGFNETEGRISGVTFKIDAGERVALIGKERSARRILFSVMAGLRPVQGGALSVLGHVMTAAPGYADWDRLLPRNVRRKMGVALTVDGLLSNVTVREGLELLYRFKYGDHNEKLRKEAEQVVKRIAKRFHFENALDKRPVMLTASERRLAAIARSFLTDPHVVMIEDPSLDIGDLNLQALWAVLGEIVSDEERTVLLSTDDWAIAANFCPRWVVCGDDSIVFDGSPKDFLASDHELVRQYRAFRETRQLYEKILEEAV